MLQFSPHALERFQQRAVQVLPGASTLGQRGLERKARNSFDGGRMLTRQEAARLIKAPIRRNRADVYKAAADGRGVWVIHFRPDGGAWARTYLAPYTLRTWPCRIPLLRRRACA